MFKRLSKSRRHSADDVALSLSSPTTLDEPPGTSTPRDNCQGIGPAALLRVSRTKYTRRSCGDASAMQALLATKQDQEQDVAEADYQMVTAVPAFIVEHEPEKQRGSSFGVWGRRMSKKIDSFRRAGSRETICSISERSDTGTNNNNCTTSNNNNLTSKMDKTLPELKSDSKSEKRIPGTFHRSPSPFKSFFIRMGSTGMLNSARSNRRSQNVDDRLKSCEKENLFRSCSTSQLNTSPTYVKGDDPSEGIDLQISNRKDKTVSCDDLAHQDDDVFDDHISDVSATLYPLGAPSMTSFNSCDFSQSRTDSPMRKSSSCDFKETKKSSFPYAFLRSKLSVLPEERHSTFVSKDERLFKTASEEHFPTLKIEDSYTGTTTLGRRRTRTSNLARGSPGKCQEPSTSKSGRNSYAEFRKNSSRCEQDRYSLNPVHLERIDDNFQQEDTGCYSSYDSSPMSLRGNCTVHHADPSQDRVDFSGRTNESRFSETSSLNVDLDMVATLRNHRRNSAPSGEQRLSSHYVSSNESGYDSDGPRGESAAASENEGLSLKCTDSSDTSSVVDSELEKPIRSSTPSECQDHENGHDPRTRESSDSDVRAGSSDLNEGIDGLRWHQSNSGRMLPSIHQTYDDAAMNSQFPICGNGMSGLQASPKLLGISQHRMRLQQDKTRFLSDIIQPPKRVRRCRMVQLHKRDPKESLGIRLAQQRLGELRYVVVQLENDGIAHRDGRLRLGDEIVEVEGKELRTLETLEEVQDFLKSFTNNKIRLITAYEETVPQVYVSPPTLPGEYEYLENAKNLSNLSLIDGQTQQGAQLEKSSKSAEESIQSTKRPDFLPLSCVTKERKSAENSLESSTEQQQYLTRHIAKFEKGYGKPSLGFSVVGGRDSPRGEMGIFVRRVFPGGQADVSKSLFQGDEILSLNGKVLRGYTHQEVIELFKAVREGPVELEITRRHRYPKTIQKSAPC
ncbi:uncharacterized protein LOC128888002 isoform X1 [Hylaeus anthracinus]|uniref:uncharacterized protein LOC128888002 isoform X1 n=2 Tax=Hylaeus anthracinus TaxID=313031 RepID=UPI0023BA0455|nr:uncharacterized protein LOC128888002 isoform X1 [Hylaeus anthracinus]XP_054000542.1 uncharacterized protein LOC128888002 isoform X1 [Hylaeus anthracinus]XP_054000543.1 uncharacterized protein LOC128888002 isoform X1 [Hylaeus anthracinus]